MGGFGSWSLGIAHPELFAAIVPVCGGGVRSEVAALKAVPVWAFHGAKDDVVLPHHSEEMVNALQQAGGDERLTMYPDADHNSWGQPPTISNSMTGFYLILRNLRCLILYSIRNRLINFVFAFIWKLETGCL